MNQIVPVSSASIKTLSDGVMGDVFCDQSHAPSHTKASEFVQISPISRPISSGVIVDVVHNRQLALLRVKKVTVKTQ